MTSLNAIDCRLVVDLGRPAAIQTSLPPTPTPGSFKTSNPATSGFSPPTRLSVCLFRLARSKQSSFGTRNLTQSGDASAVGGEEWQS